MWLCNYYYSPLSSHFTPSILDRGIKKIITGNNVICTALFFFHRKFIKKKITFKFNKEYTSSMYMMHSRAEHLEGS